MIERVARAMFAVGHADAHGPDVYDDQASWWEEAALAALAAMREPTPAMCQAAHLLVSYDLRYDDAERIWRQMINAALGESDK